MHLLDYQDCLERIVYGKRLPGALYVFRGTDSRFGEKLDTLLAQLAVAFGADERFNLVKFRLDELKLSFLEYPTFMEEAHPPLMQSLTIDLVTGKCRRNDYADHSNPPILHRKEVFLSPDHPLHPLFARLTAEEEQAELYVETATIGFKLNWERLLASKQLVIEGHTLRKTSASLSEGPDAPPVSRIHRHKTALTRYELSKPVKTLLEYGMLKLGTTIFDYGCGQGSDVRGLQALGFEARGWDPVFEPHVVKRPADVVNLGFVLNVIEDPAERLEALVNAHRHAKRLLVVSALITETVEIDRAKQFRDGVVTRRNTFQKFYEQQELHQYVEDVLEVSAVPVALGIFYVFRDPSEHQDFLSARNRRPLDWTQIAQRLGLGAPRSVWGSLYEENKDLLDVFGHRALELGRFPDAAEFPPLADVVQRLNSLNRAMRAYVEGGKITGVQWADVKVRFGIGQPAKRSWEVLYERHQDLLDEFWRMMLDLGRLPEAEEFPRMAELRERIGSSNRALKLFIQRGGGDEIKRAAESRSRDLTVYVALANLRRKVPVGHLSLTLRLDIREFFGNYTRALQKGLELLYAAGDTGEIELACEGLTIGWQDDQALYVHRSLLDELPPVLRAYVGCATVLFGDVSQADVIKLHKSSGKATFLVYDDFEGKPLPELRQRIKVNLRTRWVQVFDHSAEGQLLYFKERFLWSNHPKRVEMEAFSTKLRRLGLDPASIGRGPIRPALDELLASKGLNNNLNRCRLPIRKDKPEVSILDEE